MLTPPPHPGPPTHYTTLLASLAPQLRRGRPAPTGRALHAISTFAPRGGRRRFSQLSSRCRSRRRGTSRASRIPRMGSSPSYFRSGRRQSRGVRTSTRRGRRRRYRDSRLDGRSSSSSSLSTTTTSAFRPGGTSSGLSCICVRRSSRSYRRLSFSIPRQLSILSTTTMRGSAGLLAAS